MEGKATEVGQERFVDLVLTRTMIAERERSREGSAEEDVHFGLFGEDLDENA